MNTVIFDLDGTLTDSAEGIARSLNHTLRALGLPERPWAELLRYIGPSLTSTVSDLLDTSDKPAINRAIAIYRERYMAAGYREGQLYDGISDVLSGLRSSGSDLCIATNKLTDVANRVLRHFKIDCLFAQVHGGDHARSKADTIRVILSDPSLNGVPLVMVGDRDFDFLAATEVGIPSIGVRWGYGTEDELALATVVVDSPADLPEAIKGHARSINQMLDGKSKTSGG